MPQQQQEEEQQQQAQQQQQQERLVRAEPGRSGKQADSGGGAVQRCASAGRAWWERLDGAARRRALGNVAALAREALLRLPPSLPPAAEGRADGSAAPHPQASPPGLQTDPSISQAASGAHPMAHVLAACRHGAALAAAGTAGDGGTPTPASSGGPGSVDGAAGGAGDQAGGRRRAAPEASPPPQQQQRRHEARQWLSRQQHVDVAWAAAHLWFSGGGDAAGQLRGGVAELWRRLCVPFLAVPLLLPGLSLPELKGEVALRRDRIALEGGAKVVDESRFTGEDAHGVRVVRV